MTSTHRPKETDYLPPDQAAGAATNGDGITIDNGDTESVYATVCSIGDASINVHESVGDSGGSLVKAWNACKS